jgi:hypothetical protein
LEANPDEMAHEFMVPPEAYLDLCVLPGADPKSSPGMVALLDPFQNLLPSDCIATIDLGIGLAIYS